MSGDREPLISARDGRPCDYHYDPDGGCAGIYVDGLCDQCGRPPLTCDNGSPDASRSWGDASPMEILQARLQSAEEGLEHLKNCVMWALEQTAQRAGSPVRPEAVLDEEWSK